MSNKLDQFDFDGFTTERAEKSQEEKEKSIERKRKNKQINTAIYTLICIVCTLLIILLSFLLYFNVSPRQSPERALASYIKAVNDKNWVKVYNNSEFSTSTLFTQESFSKFCEENPRALYLADENIKKFKLIFNKLENDLYYYTVDYVTESDAKGTLYMNVKKTADGKWRFDEYKAVQHSDAFPSFTVYAPVGTEITINGLNIEPYAVLESTNPVTRKNYSYAKYIAEYIPLGEFDLVAKNAMCDDASQKITVSENSEENSLTLQMKLSENAFNSLSENTKGLISTVLSGVINNTLSTEALPLSKNFTEKKLNDLTENISNEIFAENKNYNITSFRLDKATLQSPLSEIMINSQSESTAALSYKINYSYEYTANGAGTAQARSDEGNFSVVYTIENGEWKIEEMLEQAWF